MLKYIIEKLFCHHQYESIERIEVKDVQGNVVGLKLVRSCKTCGNTKILDV